MDTMDIDNTISESAVRSKAKRRGYGVRKSRARESLDNQGGYMIVDPERNLVVGGAHFELTLEQVDTWLDSDD